MPTDLQRDLCLLTRLDIEVLQDSYDSKFHADESKPHANAVPGSISKGQIYIRINAALALLAEPFRVEFLRL